jgi:hypothetical protein
MCIQKYPDDLSSLVWTFFLVLHHAATPGIEHQNCIVGTAYEADTASGNNSTLLLVLSCYDAHTSVFMQQRAQQKEEMDHVSAAPSSFRTDLRGC